MSHWENSHFGCFDDDGTLSAAGETEFGAEFGADVEFGLDPLSLTVLGLGAFGASAAAVHHTLAAHHLISNIRNGRSVKVGHAPPKASMAMLDSDNEFEALQAAAQTDPYALGQPL